MDTFAGSRQRPDRRPHGPAGSGTGGRRPRRARRAARGGRGGAPRRGRLGSTTSLLFAELRHSAAPGRFPDEGGGSQSPRGRLRAVLRGDRTGFPEVYSGQGIADAAAMRRDGGPDDHQLHVLNFSDIPSTSRVMHGDRYERLRAVRAASTRTACSWRPTGRVAGGATGRRSPPRRPRAAGPGTTSRRRRTPGPPGPERAVVADATSTTTCCPSTSGLGAGRGVGEFVGDPLQLGLRRGGRPALVGGGRLGGGVVDAARDRSR